MADADDNNKTPAGKNGENLEFDNATEANATEANATEADTNGVEGAEGLEASEGETPAEPSIQDDIQAVTDVLDGLTDILSPQDEADYDANRMPDPGDLERFSQVLNNAKNISGRLEQLLPNVVVTAEATTSAADVSRRASSALENGLDLLQKRVDLVVSSAANTAKLSKRILIGSIAGLVLGLSMMGGMLYQIFSQSSLLDGMLVEVTGQVTEMNSALSTFEQLKVSIDQLATKQTEFTDQQVVLSAAVAKAEASADSLRKQVPEAAAKTLSVETDKVAAQVKDLGGDLRKQAKQIVSLGSKLESFKGRIAQVQALSTNVQALITLEKENYKAVLERQAALQSKGGKAVATIVPRDPNLVYYSIRNGK